MGLSVVDICNRALGMIGHDPITSLDDQTKRAGLCDQFYAGMRDEVLRLHPWNFAMRRVSLPALSDAPAWGYANAYQLPKDCLRVIKLNLNSPLTPWLVEGRTIVTDADAPLQILYIAAMDDPGDFDPLFASALSARLAAELAQPIAQSTALQKAMLDLFKMRLIEARGVDAAEAGAQQFYSDTLIEARY